MVTIRIIQDVVMAPPEDSADIPPAATKEELNDLEKDLHSIKTLHGYTKEEQAAANAKMVEMERAMICMENKLDAVESELQKLKELCDRIMKAEIVSLDGVLEKLK